MDAIYVKEDHLLRSLTIDGQPEFNCTHEVEELSKEKRVAKDYLKCYFEWTHFKVYINQVVEKIPIVVK